jgi:hypothetical protein
MVSLISGHLRAACLEFPEFPKGDGCRKRFERLTAEQGCSHVLVNTALDGYSVYREELEDPSVTTGSSNRADENTVFKELVPMLA